jgi:anti-sigma regulatory factor (Ser/Thr protein kinase)
MHQAQQTAAARAAREQDGVLPTRPGPGVPRRAVVVPPRPGAVTDPRRWPPPVLPALAAAAPWRRAILVAEPAPEAVKAAREFTSETLLRWGLRGLIQDATVVVSELVTNALRHGTRSGEDGAGGTQTELVLWGREGYLVCVVIDSNASPPMRAPAGLATEDGRGLHVVQALAATWGWTVLGIDRKAIWAVIRAPDPDSEPGASAPTGLPG